MKIAKSVVVNSIIAASIALASAAVQAGECTVMADMAYDVANLRGAGIPITAVEARLRRDVKKEDELAMSLTVVRLVYRTNGSALSLRHAVLQQCKSAIR